VRKEIVEQVRTICSDLLGAPLDLYDVIFTSNTTEAINLAAENLSLETAGDVETVAISTLMEHSSNDLPWRKFHYINLSVDDEGFFNLAELENLLIAYNQKNQYGKRRIRMVAVSGASNVLGVINDLSEISRIVHRYGAELLVDAAQLVAHRRISMEGSGIDYLAFSAHKVYAPFGCGVLVVKKGLLQVSHSGMEMIRSSGEENAGGIAALGKSLLLLQRIGFDLIRKEEQALTAHALRSLAQIKGLTVYGIKDPDSARFDQKGGVIVFGIKGKIPFSIAKQLAKRDGIGVRVGCHCAHIIIKHILNVTPGLERFQRVMQTVIPGMKFPGLVRISFGIGNTKNDIDELIRVLNEIIGKRKSGDTGNEGKKRIKEFIKARTRLIY
jgi:selenocysteine lyase/cysteine desulfurase